MALNSPKQYRKKPVVIEAVLWDGNNYAEIIRWSKLKPHQLLYGSKTPVNDPDWKLTIPTLEGNMTAEIGDYIIKGIKGEFYPCKPDIFEATYEQV